MALITDSLLGQLTGWTALQRSMLPIIQSAVWSGFTQAEVGSLLRSGGLRISNEKVRTAVNLMRGRLAKAEVINQISHDFGRSLNFWEFNDPMKQGQRYRYQWTAQIRYTLPGDDTIRERYLTVGHHSNRRLDTVAEEIVIGGLNLGTTEIGNVEEVYIVDATYDPSF